MTYMEVNRINGNYTPNNGLGLNSNLNNSKTLDKNQLTFDALVNQKIAETDNSKSELHMSKHATNRMAERGMVMSTDLMMSLTEAVEKVRDKGGKDAVMIGKEGAFIVNVPNNVIVTAITQDELKDNVFTNVDSAVLI